MKVDLVFEQVGVVLDVPESAAPHCSKDDIVNMGMEALGHHLRSMTTTTLCAAKRDEDHDETTVEVDVDDYGVEVETEEDGFTALDAEYAEGGPARQQVRLSVIQGAHRSRQTGSAVTTHLPTEHANKLRRALCSRLHTLWDEANEAANKDEVE